MAVFWILFGIICCQFITVSADDIVVACGGFVKSDVEINYSLIEVSAETAYYLSRRRHNIAGVLSGEMTVEFE